jgi:hypothetical protein
MSKQVTIEDMQKLAGELGGRCLSKTYVNENVELIWQCAKGHCWRATPARIRARHWCPVGANPFFSKTELVSLADPELRQ